MQKKEEMMTVDNSGVMEQKPVAAKKRKKLKTNPLPVMTSRRERRELARKEKTEFKPFYNDDNGVQTYEEFHGIGYERFNNKYALIKPIDGNETE